MSLLPPGLEEKLLEQLRGEAKRLYDEKSKKIDEEYRRGLEEVGKLLNEAVERFCKKVSGGEC